MTDFTALLSLFVAAFGAATILPLQSELVFIALQTTKDIQISSLILWASIGNTLGTIINYLLGIFLTRFEDRRWFPASKAQMERAKRWYARWGVWTLLLSWAPIGDAFTVIAGVMRTPFWLFITLVAIAKTTRYIVLAWITAQF